MSAGVYNKISVRGAAHPKAFTLVEVLASFVLIAIIIPVAMKGISLSTTVAANSKQQVEAASLAKTMLAEIMASDEWKTGSSSGDFGPDWPNYRWSIEILDWTETTLNQLDLHVFWDAQGRQQSITLTTLISTESN